MALTIDTDIETYLDEYDSETTPITSINKDLGCVLASTHGISNPGE
jgi:hypothetical protein